MMAAARDVLSPHTHTVLGPVSEERNLAIHFAILRDSWFVPRRAGGHCTPAHTFVQSEFGAACHVHYPSPSSTDRAVLC